ncbi:MAG: TonB-dependent receptor [Pedobacter sp.]|uniref:TonB-dependent receptor plug domain-containing protein n=1 Tax=Pedobacter sp. TaxID=1411316 RepID=UPI002808F87A|nr:TonB-dependent receptor [Pedobacter sp.]MDQ8006183.1 TonB-dependent receptor [Pedobacter sp.]
MFACFCPFWTSAQVDTSKVQRLDEVQINAKKNNFILNSPTPVQLIAGEELKRINSLSVADAVRYFSGVQLKDYGGVGGLKTINVRGMGSNHTAVFYNGVQLANAQNGQVDLGKFSLENMEEISLYSGQNSNLLQPAKAYASASMLYLKTVTPKFEHGEKHQFKVGLKGGSFALINPVVNYNYRFAERTFFNINGELLNANGKYKYRYRDLAYDTTVVRHDADIFAKRAEVGLHHLFRDSAKLQLNLYQYNSERGIPGAIVADKFRFSQRQWDDNFFVQTSYETVSNKRYQLLLNAKYAYDYTRYIDPDIKLIDGFLDNRYVQQEIYFSVANQYYITNFWKASLSTDYAKQDLDANLENFAHPTRDTWLLALASEWHWQRFKLQANVLRTYVNDKVQTNIPAGKKTKYTPTVLVSWQPLAASELRLRAFYKTIFRMPTFNDLYYTLIGNTFLRPEYAHQYDVGLTYSKNFSGTYLKGIALQSDVYYNQVTDKIVAVPGASLFRWSMSNLDKVEIKGAELNLQSFWQFNQVTAALKVNYTYEEALDVTPNGTAYRNQIPYIPVHSGSATANANYKSWGANYSFIYTGERYDQKANISANYVEPWYTHDIAFHKTFGGKKVNYRASAEINNLLNQYYDVVLNYPMPGRNYRFSIYANF